jgi:hypothetical protein
MDRGAWRGPGQNWNWQWRAVRCAMRRCSDAAVGWRGARGKKQTMGSVIRCGAQAWVFGPVGSEGLMRAGALADETQAVVWSHKAPGRKADGGRRLSISQGTSFLGNRKVRDAAVRGRCELWQFGSANWIVNLRVRRLSMRPFSVAGAEVRPTDPGNWEARSCRDRGVEAQVLRSNSACCGWLRNASGVCAAISLGGAERAIRSEVEVSG